MRSFVMKRDYINLTCQSWYLQHSHTNNVSMVTVVIFGFESMFKYNTIFCSSLSLLLYQFVLIQMDHPSECIIIADARNIIAEIVHKIAATCKS